MANFLPPAMGVGFSIYGLNILRGSNSYIPDEDIVSPFGIDILFFSTTGDLVGTIGNTYANTEYVGHKISEDLLGGFINMEFTVSRNPDFVFYNLMEVEIRVNAKHWFTGELVYTPGQERRDVNYTYTVRGYVEYLKKIKVDKLYENETVTDMVKDLIENEVAPNTPIQYNPGKIVLPSITVTKLEINNKSVFKALELILGIVNKDYATTQYRFYIEKFKDFAFMAVQDDPTYGFFEGFQFQDPDVEETIDKIINKIDIYRAVEGQDESEYVSTVEDTESQGLYGIRQSQIQISEYADQTTAENIANAKIERWKDPVTDFSIDNVILEDEPFPFEFYYLHSKYDNYTFLISEFEQLADWFLGISNTVVTEETAIVYTGKKSFKVVTASGSSAEYIEYELDQTIEFPQIIRFFVRQQNPGEVFNIIVYDKDGNTLVVFSDVLGTEAGEILQTESGFDIGLELLNSGIEIDLIDSWQKVEIDISSLQNVAKIRIIIITDEVTTSYIDRLDITTESWKRNKLRLNRVEYVQDLTSHLASMEFGERVLNAVDQIKEIDEKTKVIADIFQKQ